MNDQQFEVGKTYYTRDGSKVELLAHTTDKRFVVSQLYEIEDYDGTRTVWGPTIFADHLLVNAPTAIVDSEIEALRAEGARLRRENAELRVEAMDAERDIKSRLGALTRYKGLERIEEFMDGKITHVVTTEYCDFKVRTLAEFENKDDYGRNKGIRLICLYGGSKGDLTWRVNQYSDGSGSWRELTPCASEEEAVQVRLEKIAQALSEHFAAFNKDRPHWFLRYTELAVANDISVTAEQSALYRQYKSEELAAQIKEAQKRAVDATEKLNAIQAEFDAVMEGLKP